MRKGVFIVLDGNDGSGKATQSRLLAEHLKEQGIEVILIDFPQYRENLFGALIGECLAGQRGDFLTMDPKIVSALYALDRYESASAIRDALASGKVVIADRFASSNQIHQGGKIPQEEERQKFLVWLDRMEHEILTIPRPDKIIYLQVPVSLSLELLQKKRTAKNQLLSDGAKDVVEEDRAYLERSHETANWLASQQSGWSVIHCGTEGNMRTAEDIHVEVRAIVERLLSR